MAENNFQAPPGWEITDGLEIPGMTQLFWSVLQGYGHDIPPTYVGKTIQENGITSYVVHVAVPTNYSFLPAWESWTISVTGMDLLTTWSVAALKALTLFCELHKHEITGTPELQVEFDAFKATHLPIIDNWDETPMEYGKLVDEEMEQAKNYATEYVNTEEKKRYAFLRGMNAALKERLTWQTTGTFNDLVNAAIVQEGAMRQVEEDERKRKAPASASAAP
ncbi:hypothetical protein PR202_gb23834 [Eleusine coracana subsp. coracana]|uniref:Uncharacterized protein n=1 Tax=Eleusine coracana subsp. coracana TaxID=191504 RepID=A0AAV5FLF1_ELECO|nr:hypothetical protein PR202_gb23834 [Eleusine coracana subsp. coracana]